MFKNGHNIALDLHHLLLSDGPPHIELLLFLLFSCLLDRLEHVNHSVAKSRGGEALQLASLELNIFLLLACFYQLLDFIDLMIEVCPL